MKYYVDSKILESDNPLSLKEIFDKLEFGTDVLGAEINGEIKDFYFSPADESKIYPIFLGNENVIFEFLFFLSNSIKSNRLSISFTL